MELAEISSDLHFCQYIGVDGDPPLVRQNHTILMILGAGSAIVCRDHQPLLPDAFETSGDRWTNRFWRQLWHLILRLQVYSSC